MFVVMSMFKDGSAAYEGSASTLYVAQEIQDAIIDYRMNETESNFEAVIVAEVKAEATIGRSYMD